jgi:hypothetical protein
MILELDTIAQGERLASVRNINQLKYHIYHSLFHGTPLTAF